MADPWADDDDEELKLAIALSLGYDPEEQKKRREKGELIDLTQDDGNSGQGNNGGDAEQEDDDDLVIVDRSNAVRPKPVPKQDAAAEQPVVPSATVFSALGLDRKQMEEERLSRAYKRKVSQVDGGDRDDGRPTRRSRLDEEPPLSFVRREKGKSTIPKGPASSSAPLAISEDTKPAAPKAAASASSRPPVVLPFPRGVIKKTWAYQQPRKGDDIKIEEVLQKQHLQLAVVSSYQWDEHWMLSKIDIARTKLILVAFAANEAQKEEMRSNVPRDRIRFCFPPMHGIGAMHSKLMLLKYEGYMRIVVPTGNFMSYDWGETGTMENMVFIIDLPKFEYAEQREAQEPNAFSEDLFYFLRAQGLDEKLVSSLRNYDFTEADRYAFVHTIPGSHTEEDVWSRTGYYGFGEKVRGLVRCTAEPLDVDFVCASLGAINYGLLSAMYYACLGDPLLEYEARMGSKSKREPFTARVNFLVREHMRIFFPSRETVLQSKGGKDGAGTICFQSKWWQAPTFPRELLRDCKSVRPGVLMHSKIIYIRPNDPDLRSGRCLAYVGSANLSESAWGKLVRDRTTDKPKLTCRNWECGVLLAIEEANEGPNTPVIAEGGAQSRGANAGEDRRGDDLSDFEGRVPVPMEWPGRVICEGATADARRPWMFGEG
ncbi:tyrosyl-DNA phosphodiesterase-domain-containing protein [Chaetomium fimeti]|uniref:Tyrosyl-DNA phosphodiesterase-domain-containing protein n=1 Tax=Chaetomium fimeti TaxID=1854472 RepID=A0AAE0HGE1_9PEZI|nr:tyrosyl-DNA phosphodiesterase-domain-containing protein [Chaetomium fimeti]